MKNKKTKKSSTPPPPLPLQLEVAPGFDRASRQVVVSRGDKTFTDKFDPLKASARENWLKQVAEKIGELSPQERQDLEDQLVPKAEEADAKAAEMARAAEAELGAANKEEISATKLQETSEEVKAAARAFLKNPDLIEELEGDFRKLGIVGEFVLALTLYLVAISRLLRKPLGASVQATSATGKSYVSEIIASLVPAEWLIQATSITMNALYYMAPGALRHVFVVIGERVHARAGDQADAANLTMAFREMMTRGVLVKCVPMKGEDGQLRTVQMRQEGPIAYSETTTQQEIFQEDASRMLLLTTDESPDQTRRIMVMQARQAAGKTASDEVREAIRQKHQAVHRMLKSVRVRIPYAEHLPLDPGNVVARRTFPQLLAVIEAVALLRQQQKKVDDGQIDADLKDYEIAYLVMQPVLKRTLTPVGERPKKLLTAVLAHVQPGHSFTRNECVDWAGVQLTEVRNRLSVLLEAGLVELCDAGKGKALRYTVVTGTAKSAPPGGLPTPKQLKEMIKKGKK